MGSEMCIRDRFNGGKWLVVDVKDDKQFIEVQRLMLLKAGPVKAAGK